MTEDLTPFMQGYIEALFADDATQDALMDEHGRVQHGFRHLAPETLARIIADCERESARPDSGPDTKSAGAAFWAGRNTRTNTNEYHKTGFPPLTIQLGDDGKVRFA